MGNAIRIRTDGDHGHREAAIDRVGELLDESTRTGAIIAAVEHTRQDVRRKQKALNHPDMTQELAEILSTSEISLEYEIETAVRTE